MPLIQFTHNHSDHSTDRGFQFEFLCDKCSGKMPASAKFCPSCRAKQG